MAHFAELDENNIVLRVTVVNDEDCLDENGIESEAVGGKFCQDLLGGRWVQTSYNNRIRKQYAGVGYTYNEEANVFVAPQPYRGWIMDENFDWNPPMPKPEGNWYWCEDCGSNGEWKQVENEA